MVRSSLRSFRYSIVLVLTGASLIAVSYWLASIPNEKDLKSDSRGKMRDLLAVVASARIGNKEWEELDRVARAVLKGDREIVSIGFRDTDGTLKIASDHHPERWDNELRESRLISPVSTPVFVGQELWGNLETCYVRGNSSLLSSFTESPLARLIRNFCVIGSICCFFLVEKAMRNSIAQQVVPERVRHALNTLADGLLVLDNDAHIVLANRAFLETVDRSDAELVGTKVNELPWTDKSDRPCVEFPWMHAIANSVAVTDQMLRLKLDEDRCKIFSVNASPIGNARRGVFVTFRDVTHIEEHRADLEMMLLMLRESRDEIELKNRELEILATKDSLTECLNRRAFYESFQTVWETRDAAPISCLLIDIDHFKLVNDTHGHAAGDRVLCEVAGVLNQLPANGCLVCRYGGEEFCVLLPDVSVEQAVGCAEMIRQEISKIRLRDFPEVGLTVSIGVADTRLGAEQPQDLINQADAGLYSAKRSGRDCVVAHIGEMAECCQSEPDGDLSESLIAILDESRAIIDVQRETEVSVAGEKVQGPT